MLQQVSRAVQFEFDRTPLVQVGIGDRGLTALAGKTLLLALAALPDDDVLFFLQ